MRWSQRSAVNSAVISVFLDSRPSGKLPESRGRQTLRQRATEEIEGWTGGPAFPRKQENDSETLRVLFCASKARANPALARLRGSEGEGIFTCRPVQRRTLLNSLNLNIPKLPGSRNPLKPLPFLPGASRLARFGCVAAKGKGLHHATPHDLSEHVYETARAWWGGDPRFCSSGWMGLRAKVLANFRDGMSELWSQCLPSSSNFSWPSSPESASKRKNFLPGLWNQRAAGVERAAREVWRHLQ